MLLRGEAKPGGFQTGLGCRKWGCNKWRLKGCLAALPGNRPKSAFFVLFLPFSSSDLLKPPSLKPPFAVLQPGGFPLFSGKVQIVSRTLSGLFFVGALNRPRKEEKDKSGKSSDHPRANRENPGRIGKVPKGTKKDKKGHKRTQNEGQVQIRKPPRLNPPRLAALDLKILWVGDWSECA